MKRLFLLPALLVGTMLGQTMPVSSGTPESSIQPGTLLEQSYQISLLSVNKAERPYYLSELTEASVGLVPKNELEAWCIEMFREAFQIPGWDGVALEKQALVPLAKVNPDLAIHHFEQVQDPRPGFDGDFREDVRSQSAKKIFEPFWDEAKKANLSDKEILARVETMRKRARHFGATGSYPYVAMSWLASELAKSSSSEQQKAAVDIIAEATQFFKNEPVKFRNRNHEFLKLLETIRKNSVFQPVFAPAVRLLVNRVGDTPSIVDYKAEIKTGSGEIVTLNDRVQDLLFRAFPMIRTAAPDLVPGLLNKYPILRKSVEPLATYYAGIVPWKTTADQSKILHDRMKQEQLVDDIKELANSNLPEAQERASFLTETSLQIRGYAFLVPAIMNRDRAQAQSIYAGERTRLQEIPENADKINAEVALVEAGYFVDRDDFPDMLEEAFDHATAALEDDYRLRPQFRTDQRKEYETLSELVEFGVNHGQVSLITRITQLPNDQLRAYLLIHAAKGLTKKPEKN